MATAADILAGNGVDRLIRVHLNAGGGSAGDRAVRRFVRQYYPGTSTGSERAVVGRVNSAVASGTASRRSQNRTAVNRLNPSNVRSLSSPVPAGTRPETVATIRVTVSDQGRVDSSGRQVDERQGSVNGLRSSLINITVLPGESIRDAVARNQSSLRQEWQRIATPNGDLSGMSRSDFYEQYTVVAIYTR